MRVRPERPGRRAVLAALAGGLAAACGAVRRPRPPAMGGRGGITEGHFIAGDGYLLPTRRWWPEGRHVGTILALHGFNDYRAAWEGPARLWAAEGFLTLAYDQRGFGQTADRGLWAGTETLVRDMLEVAVYLKAQTPGLPLVLMGESMGAAIILSAAERLPGPADLAVLIAPAVWSRALMPAWQRAGMDLAEFVIPWIRLTGRGINRRPTDNFEALRTLAADPAVLKWARVDALTGLVELMTDAYDAAAAYALPSLVLLAGQEKLVPARAIEAFVDRLPANTHDILRLDGAYHMILRDRAGLTHATEVASWIRGRMAG